MTRKAELTTLLVVDGVALSVAFLLQYLSRFDWNWFGLPVGHPEAVFLPLLVLNGYWLALLGFFGMYRSRYAASRFDELFSLLKVVTAGVLLLVFAIYIDALRPGSTRWAVFSYWGIVFGLLATGRVAVRSIQKALILRGHGLHRALIVGWSDRVEQLYQEVARYPEAGLHVVGAVRMGPEPAVAEPVLVGAPTRSAGGDGASVPAPEFAETKVDTCTIEALPRLIDDLQVQDVLIALGSDDHAALLQVLHHCEGKPVALKLVPDFYTVIGGMARTEHMYGLPLIEVLPEPMPPWQQSTKRLIDVGVSLLGLVLGVPVWLATALLVKATSRGPVIYRQQRVGRHGRVFTIYKFRTMWEDAERHTGPVWAAENDTRYTPVGRWLRRLRLDEAPQLWNVLIGEMSLVGPRPERPYFVERLAEDIPLYSRRHRVKPGITGWAQVKWKYDESIEDVRQKVKYDLFYIENMTLGMDLQILVSTIRTFISGKGQ